MERERERERESKILLYHNNIFTKISFQQLILVYHSTETNIRRLVYVHVYIII